MSAATWIAVTGLAVCLIVFGWSIPRGIEMGADEGSHFVETVRPWDCGYFHTLYAWYAHGAWKLLGESVIRMRWFAIIMQLGCTIAVVGAAHGWLSRAGGRAVPSLRMLMAVTMTWSLVAYTLGSVTVTYTSLSAWFSTLWLAMVLHVDNRERKPALWAVLGVWALALLGCTAKPSTGAFLLAGSFLLTLGWRAISERVVRSIHLAALVAFLAVSALYGMNLLGGGGQQGAWDLTLKASPLANFVSWAMRYLASDSLRGAVVSLWKEPLREMLAALAFYSCTVAAAVGFIVARCILARVPAGSRAGLWAAGACVGFLIAYASGGLALVEQVTVEKRMLVLTFAGTLAFSLWSRSAGAGGAAVLGVLGVQLASDAVGIVLPGQTYFWAADHEFRVVFMLLLAAVGVWIFARQPATTAPMQDSSGNRPLLYLFMAAMPVIGWFGSGCFLGARAGYHISLWVVLALVLLASAGSVSVGRRAVGFMSLILTLLAVNAVFVTRVLRTIDAGYPMLSEATKAVKIGPQSETLLFESKVGAFISRLKSKLKENGFQKGDPIFAFYNSPGFVFVVGGASPGTSWYIDPSQAAHVTAGARIHDYNAQRIRDTSLDVVRRAFVFQTDDNTSFVELLALRGLRFPEDYDHCAKLLIPPAVNGKRKLDIWKPKPAVIPAG